MQILIAEDDAASRLVLQKSLEKLGFDCIQTQNGTEAWRAYEEVRPTVIISDWMTSGVDGLEFCKRVRANDGDTYTYFIFLTNPNDKESVVTGISAGADDYFVKPLDRADLEARLITAARVTSLHRQLAEQKMELERLNGELFEDGRRDPLTRIGNRLRMEEDLETLAARAIRYGHSFCIGLADVDDFKAYNDSCGHSAGDETLRIVARTLANHGRSGDLAYRFGGEEFLVVLPEQSIDRGIIAMDRRRKAVESLDIPHPGKDPPGAITISAGVAVFDPRDDKALEAVVRNADQALYRAKHAGRNKVVAHLPEEGPKKPSGRASSTPPGP